MYYIYLKISSGEYSSSIYVNRIKIKLKSIRKRRYKNLLCTLIKLTKELPLDLNVQFWRLANRALQTRRFTPAILLSSKTAPFIFTPEKHSSFSVWNSKSEKKSTFYLPCLLGFLRDPQNLSLLMRLLLKTRTYKIEGKKSLVIIWLEIK